MRHATTSPAVLGTIASRRALVTSSVVIGAVVLVIGFVLVSRGGDDATYPAAGALRLTDGSVVWSVRSEGKAYRTVIGASEDVVLIEARVPNEWDVPVEESGFRSRHTIALAATDGSERWRRLTADTPTPPGPIDGQGIVVLADRDVGALVGVNAVTGEEQWRLETRDVPLANSSTVAVVWTVAEPGTPSRFRGIDRVTGDELWVSDTMLLDQSGVTVARSPAAVLDEILIVPTGGTVTAIQIRTGATLWQAPALSHLVAADGIVVGKRGTSELPTSMTVTALDAASGQERWAVPQYGFHEMDLAVGGGVIVMMDQLTENYTGFPGLIAYELDSGTERWRVPLTQFFAPQRIQISGTSLVIRGDRELAVLSTIDRTRLWSATELFESVKTLPPQTISAASNGHAVVVAINSVPAPCAPQCD